MFVVDYKVLRFVETPELIQMQNYKCYGNVDTLTEEQCHELLDPIGALYQWYGNNNLILFTARESMNTLVRHLECYATTLVFKRIKIN